MTSISQESVELQAFLASLPADLRHAPGLDWTRLSAQAVEFLSRRQADPDAAHLALAGVTAASEISADSLLRLLRNLHAFFIALRTHCGMQRVADLRRESLWNAYAQGSAQTRARAQQLSAYSAVSARHLPKYLNGIEEAAAAFAMQQYELPSMPRGFLARVGKANELNNASRAHTRLAREFLLPLYPALGELVLQRKQLVERLLRAVHGAQQLAWGGATLPLSFAYADAIPWLCNEEGRRPEIRRMPPLTLSFILWDRHSWVREHPERFSEGAVRSARQAREAPAPDEYFVQFKDTAANLFWFGDLVEQRLFSYLSASSSKDTSSDARLQRVRELGFSHGCVTQQGGLLRTGSRWFTHLPSGDELLFEPEALYRGVLYGAAIATLALANGYGRSEILQISADHWAGRGESEQSRLPPLFPPGAGPLEYGRLFEVGAETAELLVEIERGLIQAHAQVPQVPATERVKGLAALRTERYLFQWQRGVLDPADLTVLVRFVLYGLRLPGGVRLNTLSTELLKESAPVPPSQIERELERLRDALLAPLAPELKPGTLTTYRQNLMMYLRFAGSAEQAYQPETLERWMVYLTQARPGKLLDRDSAHRMATPVRRVLGEAAKAGRLADENAAAFSALHVHQSGKLRPPPKEEASETDTTDEQ